MVLDRNGNYVQVLVTQVVSVKAGKKVSHGNEKTFARSEYTLIII
jgi:hypothetical protein